MSGSLRRYPPIYTLPGTLLSTSRSCDRELKKIPDAGQLWLGELDKPEHMSGSPRRHPPIYTLPGSRVELSLLPRIGRWCNSDKMMEQKHSTHSGFNKSKAAFPPSIRRFPAQPVLMAVVKKWGQRRIIPSGAASTTFALITATSSLGTVLRGCHFTSPAGSSPSARGRGETMG